MANELIRMKSGLIKNIKKNATTGQSPVSIQAGTIYFAVDDNKETGKILYDVDSTHRIVMSTQAEYADQAGIAQNVDGVVSIAHGGTGGMTTSAARSNLELGNAKIFFGTCNTAAATVNKAVTCSEFKSSDLVAGSIILVSFTNTNSGAVGSLTLNVNNTGAKSIKKYYNYTISNLTNAAELVANSVIPFVFNGLNWIAFGLDYNSTYSVLAQDVANAGTSTAGRLITAKVLHDTIINEINKLDIEDTADSTKYVSSVSEADGKIAVSRVSFSPSITLTSGDSSNAPKVNVTVAGNSGTAQSLNKASTSAYGATKLSSTSSSTEEGLAATPKGVWAAINTLDGAITGTPSAAKTITTFSQTDGKVTATFGNIAIGAGQITSGTLPVSRGGTGQTSVANIKAGKDASGNTITTTYATKAELNNLLALNDAMIFKGTISTASDVPSPPYDAGWVYKVATFGTYAGKICEVGDLFICVREKAAGATASDDDWMVVQTNLDNGLFKGTNTFSDGQMLLADSTVGKVKAVNINPTINMTAGTSSAAPQFTISVGGETSSSASIGTATTGLYGATKLSDATNSTSTSLAATANAVKKAYDLAASKTSNVGTITGVTAGTGLTGGGTSGTVTLNHSNSINAITTEGLYKIKFDGQGHITGALSQGVTDNSSSTAVTSTDTNLITARTLYYAGYTKNTGTVTSVTLTQGDGITISNSGTAITSSGSRTISHTVPSGASASTYGTASSRTYIQTVTTDKFGHITGITTGSETVTDTHYNAKNITTNSATGKTQTTTALTNGNVYLNLIENNTVRSTHKISGTNLIGVTTDSSGNISVAHTVPSNASSGAKGGSGRTYLQTITTDAYGHITGYTTGTETVTNSDTKVNVTLATTTKAYLLGTSTTPTTTAQGVTAIADTGVYLDTTAGKLTATSFAGNGASLTSLNASNISSGTLAKERLATSGVTAGTYQGITVDAYGRVTGAVNQGYTTNTGTVTKVTAGTGLNTSANQAESATKGSITTTGTLYLTKSGATAGTYGPSAAATTGTNSVNIPYITVDAYGRVTSISNRTYTGVNTDVQVTQLAAITTAGEYPMILGGTTTTGSYTGAVNKIAKVTANPSTGTVSATKFRVAEAVTLEYNLTTKSLDFIFA